jgi:hypothetical protein
MKKQLQKKLTHKKNKNSSHSKKHTRSKKHNRKSIKVGGNVFELMQGSMYTIKKPNTQEDDKIYEITFIFDYDGETIYTFEQRNVPTNPDKLEIKLSQIGNNKNQFLIRKVKDPQRIR